MTKCSMQGQRNEECKQGPTQTAASKKAATRAHLPLLDVLLGLDAVQTLLNCQCSRAFLLAFWGRFHVHARAVAASTYSSRAHCHSFGG